MPTPSIHLTKSGLVNLADLLATARTGFTFLARDSEDDRGLAMWDTFIHDLADLLAAGNQLFDRVKFYRAAGMAKAAEFEKALREPVHIPTVTEEAVRLRLGD